MLQVYDDCDGSFKKMYYLVMKPVLTYNTLHHFIIFITIIFRVREWPITDTIKPLVVVVVNVFVICRAFAWFQPTSHLRELCVATVTAEVPEATMVVSKK